MKEYKLKINGGYDFVVVPPQTISSLISKIYDSPNAELTVCAEDIMPAGFAEYIVNVINSNRQTNIRFRFRQIIADPITKRELYQLMQEQLNLMDVNRTPCFENIKLVDTMTGEAGFDIACTEPFFWACKDTAAKFVYTFSDGGERTLIIEYG